MYGRHEIGWIFTCYPTEQALKVSVALNEIHNSSGDKRILEQLYLWVQLLKFGNRGADSEIRWTHWDLKNSVVVVREELFVACPEEVRVCEQHPEVEERVPVLEEAEFVSWAQRFEDPAAID